MIFANPVNLDRLAAFLRSTAGLKLKRSRTFYRGRVHESRAPFWRRRLRLEVNVYQEVDEPRIDVYHVWWPTPKPVEYDVPILRQLLLGAADGDVPADRLPYEAQVDLLIGHWDDLWAAVGGESPHTRRYSVLAFRAATAERRRRRSRGSA
jgi:hypothetical protein